MITKEKIKQAQELYNNLGNIKKVARITHISYDTLRDYIQGKKITPKKRDTKSYRNIVKKQCIEYKGGKCEICGYDKCLEALDFHHVNPKDKDFNISGGTRSFDTLRSELDKCILVCSNCHREIHAGLIKM